MRIHYDPNVDAMTIELAESAVADSDEVAPGVIVDLDAEGHVIAIEILDAGKFGRNVRDIHYQILTGETERE